MGKHRLKNPSPGSRLRIYEISAAAAPILVAYGIIAQDKVGLWLALVGALVGTGSNLLARANVPGANDATN